MESKSKSKKQPGNALPSKIKDIPLHTTDRRVAQQRIEQIVKEKQMEAIGLLAPYAVRMASQTRLERHLSDYVADLQAVGRGGQYIYRRLNRPHALGFGEITDDKPSAEFIPEARTEGRLVSGIP